MFEASLNELEKRLRSRFEHLSIVRDAPMARYTTLHLGGPADMIVSPERPEQVRQTLVCAHELGLPVIIHDREAHHDCLEVVKAHPNVKGVYHCYSGSLEDAKILTKLGWMISFTGVVTFKNARKSLEVIEWLPMDRIMIETDAPYLTPEPWRGKRNDSSKVYRVAETIAAVKGIAPEEAARITLENGKRFFGIE